MARRLIPIQNKLEEITEQGKRIRRRQEKLKDDWDFLVDMMLTKPYKDMAAHRRLLAEWETEIDKLENDLQYLRQEYQKYHQVLTSKIK